MSTLYPATPEIDAYLARLGFRTAYRPVDRPEYVDPDVANVLAEFDGDDLGYGFAPNGVDA
jgi:hypothetical protein